MSLYLCSVFLFILFFNFFACCFVGLFLFFHTDVNIADPLKASCIP